MALLKRKKSLTNRLMVIIAIAVVFNLLFSVLLFFGSGSFALARTDSFEDFAGTVAQDGDHMRLHFAKDSLNAVIVANSIDQRIEKLAAEERVNPLLIAQSDELRRNMLDIAMNGLQSVLATNDYTGVFFLPLCAEEEGETARVGVCSEGLYLRKTPFGPLGEQTVLERGPKIMAINYGARVMAGWQPTMTLADGGDTFLERMVARKYDNNSHATRDDGYWTRPMDLFGTGVKGIYFITPILNDDDRVYAILGIEMSESKLLKAVLPGSGGRYATSYYFVPSSTQVRGPDWLLAAQPITLKDGRDIIEREPDAVSLLPGGRVKVGEYDLAKAEGGGRYVAVFHELNTYSTFSPYKDEDMALVGFSQRSSVLARFYKSARNIGASLFAATGLAAVAVYAISKRRINRIIKASRRLGDTRMLDGVFGFEKVDIDEIDALTSTLEELNERVRESALRVSTIFDMLEMPIGCYEYSKDKRDLVFVTPSLHGMLGLDDGEGSMYVEMPRWREVYARLTAHPCPDVMNTYEWCPNPEAPPKYFRLEEVERSGYVVGIITDVTGQTVATKELNLRASYDELTHLFNRHSFRRESLRKIEENPRKKGVMMFGDLDGLKRVNDEYGHSQGDRFIQAAADQMRTLESIGGVVARLSGDEFAAYIHGFDTAEEARTALYTCLMRAPAVTLGLPDGTSREVSMSRGIAVYPDDSGELSTLLSCADRAMYQAKYSHKGSLVEYGKCAELDNETLHSMQNELVRMVKEHQFYYVYQPVYEVRTMRLEGYSVYIRPQSRLLSDPRVALETALMMSLQGRLSRMLFEDNLTMLKGGDPAPPCRLMLKTMKYSMIGENDMAELVEAYPDGLRRLDVLIPAETMSNSSNVESKMTMCRKTGARVALENFGANVSDFLELLDLRPDIVRIEMGRIRDASRELKTRQDFEVILDECKSRGILLFATEVETEADFDLVRQWGFDLAQGYYLGYPGREFKPPV